MMGAKIVAVLCTLLVVQIQADVNNVELEGLTGLLDPVIRIVNATENAILRGLANFKAGVVESEQKLQIIAHIIVNATNNLLTNLKDDLNEDLNKLKNQTSDAGKKLIDCVESEGNDTVAIAVNLVNGTIGCVNDNIGHVEQVIPPWIGQLEDVIRTVQNTTNGLEECNRLNIVLLASCVRKVGTQVSHDVQPINGIIERGIQEINAASEKYLGHEVAVCIKERAQASRKQALEVFNKVATCATH
ncbi:unnamed protein product [Acanthoscelides obtectus]|uniref:Uncharacterized protein n=1 Tax=Acanthoscelides obtectus TaxID=200917 RepID=A0A9P0LKR5_ACAOB|nr:unnamed protein product [Acanthoscelides obtectus]